MEHTIERSKHIKSNYIFFLIEGTFFFIATSILTQDGVIPVFIDTFTGSLTLVGTAVTIRVLFKSLPIILLGHRLNSIKNMPRFTAVLMLLTRPL